MDNFLSRIYLRGYLKNYELKEGDVVLDLGAFFGGFSIMAAKKVGPKGKVIAYEPDKKNFSILKENVKKSGLKNIVLINKAVFNEKRVLSVTNDFNCSNIFSKKSKKFNKIQADTLDNELKRMKIKKVNFLKMDVEGAELEILEGLKKSLKIIDNFTIACYHKRNGRITGELLKPFFESNGYNAKMGFLLHLTLYASKK